MGKTDINTAAEVKEFLGSVGDLSGLASRTNFIGLNPMKSLVWSGIVQGFSTPLLLLLIMLMTNNRAIMGEQVKSCALNILGWVTTGAIFTATVDS